MQTVHPFGSFIYSFPTQQDCVLPVVYLRISRYSKVTYFVYHRQNYHKTKSGTQR